MNDAAARGVLFAVLGALLFAGCAVLPDGAGRPDLSGLHSWAAQLSGLERPGAIDHLAAADVDLVVIDRLSSTAGAEGFPMDAVVRQLRASSGATRDGKLCLAYMNVGQAESYRTYWGGSWREPSETEEAEPSFLLGPDPDGWTSNFVVKFWDDSWRDILVAGPDSLLVGAIDEGFDGVMLDWVEGWEDPAVQSAATAEGVDAGERMAWLIGDIARRGRERHPGFLVVLNGGAGLMERQPELAEVIDGVVQESVTFTGKASVRWDDAESADLPPTDRDGLKERLAAIRRRGVAVLSLDYAAQPAHRQKAIAVAREAGFVPFVSRTPLDRLPRP